MTRSTGLPATGPRRAVPAPASSPHPPLPLFADRRLLGAALAAYAPHADLSELIGAAAVDLADPMALASATRAYLNRENHLVQPGVGESRWEHVRVGDLVEFGGTVQRNALVDLLELVTRLFLAEEFTDAARLPPPRGRPTSINRRVAPPPAEQEVGLAVFRMVLNDLRSARTVDIPLQLTTSDMGCILTLPPSLDQDLSIEDLVDMPVRVLARVVRVVGPEQTLNLLRRSALGEFTTDLIQAGLAQIAQTPDLTVPLVDVALPGPVLQLLPLALFV